VRAAAEGVRQHRGDGQGGADGIAIQRAGEINDDGNNNGVGRLGRRRRINHQHDGMAPCLVDKVGEATAGQHHNPC
jgi:hypothetical protein